MRIYTVGHSNHPSEAFVALLRTHGVTALADVRSAPYSRFNPQFNRETLARALEAQSIRYVFLGRELGARPDDPACYENGRVRYARLARTALFRNGLDRVIEDADRAAEGARRPRLALMCAEKDPLECHRTILVARELVRRGVGVAHILADGRLEPHDATIERLLERHGLDQPDLFASRAERIERAYDAQAGRMAWADEDAAGPAPDPADPDVATFDAGRVHGRARDPADPDMVTPDVGRGPAPDPADPDVATPDAGRAHGRTRETRP